MLNRLLCSAPVKRHFRYERIRRSAPSGFCHDFGTKSGVPPDSTPWFQLHTTPPTPRRASPYGLGSGNAGFDHGNGGERPAWGITNGKGHCRCKVLSVNGTETVKNVTCTRANMVRALACVRPNAGSFPRSRVIRCTRCLISRSSKSFSSCFWTRECFELGRVTATISATSNRNCRSALSPSMTYAPPT